MQWSIGMGQAVVRLSLDKVTWAPLGGFSLLAGREVPQGYSFFFFNNENHVGCNKKDLQEPEVHIVKAVVFPGVTYGCESWTIEKAEH